MEEKKLSLWLIPEKQAYETLATVITDLANQYHSPRFAPHTTLLMRVIPLDHLDGLIENFVQKLKLFTITLTQAQTGHKPHEAVFLKAESWHLLEAHKKALEMIPNNHPGTYMSHLSLLYGNFPQAVKEEIIKKILLPLPFTFAVETLCLYDTSNENEELWYKVNEYKLK